jgi:hypothetical protein
MASTTTNMAHYNRNYLRRICVAAAGKRTLAAIRTIERLHAKLNRTTNRLVAARTKIEQQDLTIFFLARLTKKAKKRAGKARKEALWLKGELWRMRKEAWEGGKTSVGYGQGDTKALSVMVEEGSAGEGIFDRNHAKEDPVERLKGSAEVSGQVERVSGGERHGQRSERGQQWWQPQQQRAQY